MEPAPPGSPLYQALLKVAIGLCVLSLVALAVSSFQTPDPGNDHQPAPFSCSSLP